MAGRFCRLVPTDIAHAPALHAAFAADEGGRDWTYLPYGPFAHEDDVARWLEQTCLGDDPLFFTIEDGAGEAAGVASFMRIAPQAATIEIGHIHLAPRLQRTAAATEALALMLARAFDELGYRRCEWKCDALNAASRRAALRLGFTYEGTFRKAAVVKGRNRDTAWFALLDGEWPDRRAAFAAWLAACDDDGRQRAPLAR